MCEGGCVVNLLNWGGKKFPGRRGKGDRDAHGAEGGKRRSPVNVSSVTKVRIKTVKSRRIDRGQGESVLGHIRGAEERRRRERQVKGEKTSTCAWKGRQSAFVLVEVQRKTKKKRGG